MQKITVPQFFILLFLCRSFTFFTFTPGSGHTLTNTSSLLGLLLACLGSIILLIPVWMLLRRHPGMGLIEYAFHRSPGAGTATATFFSLYTLFEAVGSVVHFTVFLTTAIYPQESAWGFVLLFTLAALYLVWMGLEATARLSGLILAALIFSMILISGAFVPEWETLRLCSPLIDGADPVLRSAAVTLGETVEFVPMLLLIPYMKDADKKMTRGFLWWILAVFLALGGISLLLAASIGEYADTQSYPLYAAAKMTRLFYFQRLDALHLFLWTLLGMVKTALFLYVSRQSLFCIVGKRVQKWMLPLLGGITIVGSILLCRSFKAYEAYDAISLSGVPLLLCVLIVPLLLCLCRKKGGDAV